MRFFFFLKGNFFLFLFLLFQNSSDPNVTPDDVTLLLYLITSIYCWKDEISIANRKWLTKRGEGGGGGGGGRGACVLLT